MSKRQYLVRYQSGGELETSTTSLKAAASQGTRIRPEDKVIAATEIFRSAALQVKYTGVGLEVMVTLFDGITITAPTTEALNKILAQLGYKSVRETMNILNTARGPFFIDKDTPSYMDPGSEAYHSM